MKYTVIGMYEDNGQIWGTSVDAETPAQAARGAALEMLKINEWEEDDLSNLLIIDVIKGDHKLLLGNTEMIPASEF